jgi:hypothetical protein
MQKGAARLGPRRERPVERVMAGKGNRNASNGNRQAGKAAQRHQSCRTGVNQALPGR